MTYEYRYGTNTPEPRAACGWSLRGKVEGDRLTAVAHGYKPIVLYDGADEDEAYFALLSLHYGIYESLPGQQRLLRDAGHGRLLTGSEIPGVTQFGWRRTVLIRALLMQQDPPRNTTSRLWSNVRLTAWGLLQGLLDRRDVPTAVLSKVAALEDSIRRHDEEELVRADNDELRFLDVR